MPINKLYLLISAARKRDCKVLKAIACKSVEFANAKRSSLAVDQLPAVLMLGRHYRASQTVRWKPWSAAVLLSPHSEPCSLHINMQGKCLLSAEKGFLRAGQFRMIFESSHTYI